MKSSLRSPILVAMLAMFGAGVAFAQNAALSSDITALSASGGTVTLTATVNYDSTPGALGWSIALPEDWTLVGISGPNVPPIAPEVGSGGTLEFAYMSVPSQRAEFSVQVRYPANATAAKAAPTVLVRTNGKLTTLTPPPVTLQLEKSGAARGTAN